MPARALKTSAAVALLASAALAVSPAAATPVVRILTPPDGGVALGDTDIQVQAVPPPGARILKVEIYVDDRLIATLLDPPYKAEWDAGDGTRSRTIRARVYASDGTNASGTARTRALIGAERADVTLVEVYATVRDSQGKFLRNLDKENFTVLESGSPQEIAVFLKEPKPAHIVLLFDASNSMKQEDRLAVAQDAAVGFLAALQPQDTAALITFNDTPVLLEERTTDKKRIESAVRGIPATGGTALYDAIMAAVELLEGTEGRKAIILLSDGRDESVDGMGPGSISTFEETLDAVLESETMIYAIGTGENFEEEYDYYRRRTLGEVLGTLAERSGGRAHFIKKASKLDSAYERIADELRHQYTIAYYPPRSERGVELDSKGREWRSIEVVVDRPRVKVTARSGYFAR